MSRTLTQREIQSPEKKKLGMREEQDLMKQFQFLLRKKNKITYSLSIEDQDFHAGDVSEHPVEVITNRTHEHHRFLPFCVLPFSNPCNTRTNQEEEAEEWRRRRRNPGSRKIYFRDGFLTIPSMFSGWKSRVRSSYSLAGYFFFIPAR